MIKLQYMGDVMTTYQRFLWGILAGIALICVKFVGPDLLYLKSLVASANTVEWIFYILLSAVTIFLGGISALFCKDTEPSRILVFCVSFPALVTAATSQTREPITADIASTRTVREAPATTMFDLGFVTSAWAQPAVPNAAYDCQEASFIEQLGIAAKNYVAGSQQSISFSVVLASSTDLGAAKALADQYAAKAGDRKVSVGCRRPGNAYFPVVLGKPMDMAAAASLRALVIGEGWAPADTYLSNYPFLTAIYEAR